MKKPAFIITETICSVILAASVAAVAVLAVDLNTDQFHLDRFNPFTQGNSVSEQKKQQTSKNSADSSDQKKTDAQVSEKGAAEKETSDTKNADTSEVSHDTSDQKKTAVRFLPEPENLDHQPEDLVNMLTRYTYTLEDSVDGNKVILIDTASGSDRTKAVIYCYQRSGSTGYWWNVAGEGKALCEEAYIGENGSEFDPAPDSGITPGGIFSAGKGFYISDKPNTTYSLFQITDDTYWVTDPESAFYNQQVEGTENKDWSKADHMITSDKSYKYGLVINYNTSDPDKDRSSAVFIQCGSSPTQGSIAVPEDVMKSILEWLDEDSYVSVFITI